MNNDLILLRQEYELSIIRQKQAFKAQSGEGDRSKLASIAAATTRDYNDNRRKYEAAVYQHWKENNEYTY